jgi:Tol biopolymer transport system component
MSPIAGMACTRPNLSSDNDWIVYNKQDEIFAMKSDGSNDNRVTIPQLERPGGEEQNRSPRYSPDGSAIAFFSNGRGSFEVWIARGSGVSWTGTPLTRPGDKSRGAIYPVWSPDGSELAYKSVGNNQEPPQTFVADVNHPEKPPEMLAEFKMDPAGSFTAWSWSSHENKLAGYRQRADGKFTGIFVYSFNNKQYKQLTSFGNDPVWLNDSPRILFHYNGRIYMVDSSLAEAEKHVRLVLSVYPDEVARRGFSISSDNKWIYFSREAISNHLWVGTYEGPPSLFSRIRGWFNRTEE